jgi:hypothetical protein
VAGVHTVRFRVGANGEVEAPTVLVDTLRIAGGDNQELARVRRGLARTVRGFAFKKQRGAATVTLPIVLER